MNIAWMPIAFLLFETAISQQTENKEGRTIVHFCDKRVNGCGSKGACKEGRGGNRCQCSQGWMGIQCKRPCQDVYMSCKRWDKENRCYWGKFVSLFFDDNCAATCNACQTHPKIKLDIPLAPLLEPLSWIVGEWETVTETGDKFPLSMLGPYKEILRFKPSLVPMFDRPPLNFSSVATRIGENEDKQVDVGWMTSSPIAEDTGFHTKEVQNPQDHVAIELNSNTGINTIEEGVMEGKKIILKTTFKHAFPGMENRLFKSAERSFGLNGDQRLIEEGIVLAKDGSERRWRKTFSRVHDYLSVDA